MTRGNKNRQIRGLLMSTRQFLIVGIRGIEGLWWVVGWLEEGREWRLWGEKKIKRMGRSRRGKIRVKWGGLERS